MNDTKTLLKKDLIDIVKEVMSLAEEKERKKKRKITKLIQVTSPEEGDGIGLAGGDDTGGGSITGTPTGTTTGADDPGLSGDEEEETEEETEEEAEEEAEEASVDRLEDQWKERKVEDQKDNKVLYSFDKGEIRLFQLEGPFDEEVRLKIDKFKNDPPYEYKYFKYTFTRPIEDMTPEMAARPPESDFFRVEAEFAEVPEVIAKGKYKKIILQNQRTGTSIAGTDQRRKPIKR